MKTNKLYSIVVISAIIFSTVLTNTYGKGGSSSSSSSSSSSRGSSSGGSSNGGSSNTGGDNSGSDFTGRNNTGGENSGSPKNHGQSGFPSGCGDQVKNIYGESIKLKAKIHKDSINNANRIMNKIMINNGSGTLNQIQDRLRNQLHIMEQIHNNTNTGTTNSGTIDTFNYLQLRLQYKIGIYGELANIAQNMINTQTNSMNIFLRNFENKYFNENEDKRMIQYERLLGSINKIQEKAGNLKLNEEKKGQIKKSLKYLELKMYGMIENLENN